MFEVCTSFLIMVSLSCCFLLLVHSRFLGYKIKPAKPVVYIALPLMLLAFVFLIWSDFQSGDYSNSGLFTILFFVFIPMMFLDTKKKKLPIIWLGLVVNFLFDLLSTLLDNVITHFITFESDWFSDNINSGLVLIAIITLLLLLRNQRLSNSREFILRIPSVFYIVSLVLMMVLYTVILSIDSTENTLMFYLFSAVFIMSAFICLAYVVVKYINVSIEQIESMAILELQTKHYEELAQKNQDVRRFRHDIKNNLFALNILLNDGKLEEAKKFMDNLSVSIKETENKYSTGNYLADAILSHKADTAAKDNISIDFNGVIPSDRINNNDVCTILTNILDNAIRACISIAPCTIKVAAATTEKGVTFTISNPVSQKVEIKNNSIKTTKNDMDNHGLGIGNVKRIAEKYNGYVNLNCTDTEFSIKIGLLC